MKKIISVAVILVIGTVYAIAGDKKADKKYFTITDVKITSIMDKDSVPAPDELPKPPSTVESSSSTAGNFFPTLEDVEGIIDALDKIVNLAQKIWEIIEKNQPVVDISINYANAIPYGINHWTQLQGWSKPKTVKYSFVARNGYGAEVVKVIYQVHAIYGGNYQGKGKFLTGVTVEPISIKTLWGYKVSLSAQVPDSTITNVGTHEDPIAAMQVQLKWTIHTAIKDLQQKAIYYVDGTGKIEEIASPFLKSPDNVRSIKVEPVEVEIIKDIKF
ncbi:MAG: hypothetical protein ACP5PA_01445 [Elusimicrobiales bacterium]